MVDKTSLTAEQSEAITIQTDDVGFTIVTHVDTGSLLDLERSKDRENLPRFGGKGCSLYRAPHQPARLQASGNSVPDDVWESFAHAMMRVKYRIYKLGFVGLLMFALLWLLPRIFHDRMLVILGEDFLAVYPIVIFSCFVRWCARRDALRYIGPFFRAVVAAHQGRFAEHGVRLYYVEETRHSCWYGQHVTSYVIFRWTDVADQQQAQAMGTAGAMV
jgi:hypothetical protein